jgi:hypothetical protein
LNIVVDMPGTFACLSIGLISGLNTFWMITTGRNDEGPDRKDDPESHASDVRFTAALTGILIVGGLVCLAMGI